MSPESFSESIMTAKAKPVVPAKDIHGTLCIHHRVYRGEIVDACSEPAAVALGHGWLCERHYGQQEQQIVRDRFQGTL
jgi:hypothetical protein